MTCERSSFVLGHFPSLVPHAFSACHAAYPGSVDAEDNDVGVCVCITGLIEFVEPGLLLKPSPGLNPPIKLEDESRSSNEPGTGFEFCLGGDVAAVELGEERHRSSKLKSAGAMGMGGDSSGKDMNSELEARVKYGLGEDAGRLSPNPKSMAMALSLAVACGLSSRTFNIAGSKLVNELQSKASPLGGEGCARDGDRDDEVDESDELPAVGALAPSFDTEKVNFLSDTFSFCSRERRSRRFSFS